MLQTELKNFSSSANSKKPPLWEVFLLMCLNFVRAHWDEGELLCLISMTTNSDFVPVLNLMAQSERPDVTIKFVCFRFSYP